MDFSNIARQLNESPEDPAYTVAAASEEKATAGSAKQREGTRERKQIQKNQMAQQKSTVSKSDVSYASEEARADREQTRMMESSKSDWRKELIEAAEPDEEGNHPYVDVMPFMDQKLQELKKQMKAAAAKQAGGNMAKMAESRDEAVHMVNQALEMVGLVPAETLGRLPHQLSGGQRQRVMVARALLLKPRVILADEPVSAVDASLRATILDAVSRLNKELGIAVVYVTHDLTTAYQISDEIMILYKGNLVEAGDVETVIKKPKHPYTQLLIDSIPEADPNKKWGKLDMKKTQEKIVTAPSVGWRK